MGNNSFHHQGLSDGVWSAEMPWKAQTPMSQRQNFIQQACVIGVNVSQLCREYGISRKTGYKWLQRHGQQGEQGLLDQSRRPHNSPGQTSAEYPADPIIRKVQSDGHIYFRGRVCRVSKAVRGQPVAIRSDPVTDGEYI